MKKCANCGRISGSNNAFKCIHCGGTLITAESIVCVNCGATVDCDSEFCENCGAEINANYDVPSDSLVMGYTRGSIDTEKRDIKKILIIAISIVVAACIIAATIVGLTLLKNDENPDSEENENEIVDEKEEDDKSGEDKESENQGEESLLSENGKKDTEPPEDSEISEDSENHEESENREDLEKPEESEKPAPLENDDERIEEETRKNEEFMLLENAVDNYVRSFVDALNNGDSSYMLPYTMAGNSSSNVYKTQSEFIHSGKYIYEEYIDSYITSDVRYENSNTCVISVYEIYNVMGSDGILKYHEQSVDYRMKRDSYGDWKVYEFVGSVKVQ